MKILLLVPEYPPNTIGGGGIVYENLAKEYLKRGHKVVVMHANYKAESFFKKISFTKTEGLGFFNVPLIPYPKFGNFATSMPASIPATFQTIKIMRKNSFDVIHAHGVGHAFIDTCVLFSKKPVVLTVHGIPDPDSKVSNFIYSIYKKVVTRNVLKRATQVTAVSKFTADMVRKIANVSVVVIGNGLDTAGLTINKSVPKNKKYTILSVGRVVGMKGYEMTIELLPKFIKKYRQVEYVIVGHDTGYKSTLLKFAKTIGVAKNVRFVGFIGKGKVSKLLNTCDLVSITSTKEPFNIFALEAMYFSKTIITTFGGGLKTTIGNYNKAVDIKSSNLLIQIEKKRKVKSNFDAKEYTWSKISNKYIKLLKKYEQK